MTRGRGGHKGKQSKTQRLEEQERKRDERTKRNAYRKKKKDETYLADDDNFAGFATQLQTMGLELRDIPGDGNCLFRALGDQLEGHCRNHLQHRHETVQYMKDNRDDFEPFVEDDVPFDRHVANLGKSGTYAGNDSIVAFARMNRVNVVIHQLNNPVWKINGCDALGSKELHISYHNGDHYSSVRKYGDKTDNPTKFASGNGQQSSVSSNTNTQTKARHKKGKSKPLQESTSNNESSSSASATASAAFVGASNIPVPESEFEASGGMCNGGMGEMTDMEIQVMQTTGCQDLRLIRDSLEDNFYDIESTVDFIIQITAAAGQVKNSLSETEMQSLQSQELKPEAGEGADESAMEAEDGASSSLWSSEGTGTRLFGAPSEPESSSSNKKTEPNRTGNKQNSRQNSRNVKQQKRLEKKQRQMERHRQKVTGESSSSSPTSNAGNVDDATDPSTVPLNELGALHI